MKSKIIRKLIQPIVLFCVRQGVKFQEVSQILKEEFVTQASNELLLSEDKINISRLSAITGIHRKDLKSRNTLRNENKAVSGVNLISRIIGFWQSHPKFASNKKPLSLSIGGQNSKFTQLVKSVSTDLHPGTVLFELQRLGLVKVKDNNVKLISRVANLKSFPIEAYQVLAQDSSVLFEAVENNIISKGDNIPHLHASTHYVNLDPSKELEIRKWLLEKGSKLHREARDFLSKHDLDLRKIKSKGKCLEVYLGSFSLVKDEK